LDMRDEQAASAAVVGGAAYPDAFYVLRGGIK